MYFIYQRRMSTKARQQWVKIWTGTKPGPNQKLEPVLYLRGILKGQEIQKWLPHNRSFAFSWIVISFSLIRKPELDQDWTRTKPRSEPRNQKQRKDCCITFWKLKKSTAIAKKTLSQPGTSAFPNRTQFWPNTDEDLSAFFNSAWCKKKRMKPEFNQDWTSSKPRFEPEQ